MRPTLNSDGTMVQLNETHAIAWDAANDRPLGWDGAAGRLWEAAKAEHGIASPDPFAGPPLDDVKARAATQIDAAAEREREKYITPGAGQALVYEAKRTEVARWHNAGDPAEPDAALYPWAADRADRLDVSIAEVLSVWAAQSAAWAAVGIAIERAREAAKEAVTAVEDAAAVQAIVDGLAWPAGPG